MPKISQFLVSQNDQKAAHKLIELGIALSSEKNRDALLEKILIEAKNLTYADGGTLYLREENNLHFAIMRTNSLNIAIGGTTGKEIKFPPLKLYDDNGEPNHHNIATHVALTGKTTSVEDAYITKNFDFSGTKEFDQGTGYRSKSLLTVPLKNYQQETIGVLQLLNSQHQQTGEVQPFPEYQHNWVEALASQAAVALNNRNLIEDQKALLEAFIKVIAFAIDRKSRYTGAHCERVPVLTEMLARSVHDSNEYPFRDFHLNGEEWYELRIASWMHDCGKITTPEYVMDKGTKLETIYDRLNTIEARFSAIHKDMEISALTEILATPKDRHSTIKARLARQQADLAEDLDYIRHVNIGSEWLSDEAVQRIEDIGKRQWIDVNGIPQALLTDNEIYNLSIRRGTLTTEERKLINDHIIVTIDILEQLPFPKNLCRVPEYAGGHHEKMDGTGYPNGLTKEQLSIPARVIAIADIFEALTAADRPYKKPKLLTESIDIMYKMSCNNHIDADLFRLFLTSGVYLDYAHKFLPPEQIDTVDISQYLD